MKARDESIPMDVLVMAYSRGVFPMAMPGGDIGWFSPDPRGIIPLDGFHIPHGTARVLKKAPFEVRVDTAFREVMEGCADRAETWIDARILASYTRLHDSGLAHSVECWREGQLVGGLYGVSLGGAFFGESMFSRERDASKVALCHLVGRLIGGGYGLLDIQWTTSHLETFGAVEISRRRYLKLLERSLELRGDFRGVG